MTTAKHKKISQDNITALLSAFTDNQINIAGCKMTLVRAGRYFIEVKGARGAKYRIFAAPGVKVIQDETLPVYTLSRHAASVDFTFFDGHAIELG